MRDHPDTMTTSTPPVVPRPTTRDQQGLLDALAAIDREGWDGETATALLTYIRHRVIRQLTIDLGLRGGAASDAEATAWGAVWIQLRDPHLRSVKSPWGVVWQAARRALIGEILASRWVSDWRRAWERDVEERAGRRVRPISLERLYSAGFELASFDPTPGRTEHTAVSAALDLAAGALADSGWNAAQAEEIVAEVALMEEPLSQGTTVVGWRPLAERLGLPPWQARRLTFVLRGSIDRPGLLARLITEGPDAARSSEVREGLACTLVRTAPTPTRAPGVRRRRRPPQELPSPPCPQLEASGVTSAAPAVAHLTP